MKEQSLIIRRIEIENVKSLSNVSIDLSEGNTVKNWLLIFGENGVGKSTLLKCITLALGNKDDAATLFKTPESEWVRTSTTKEKARIYVEFDGPKINKKRPSVEIIIQKRQGSEFISEYNDYPLQEEPPYRRVFACGYGAGRGVEGDQTPMRYRLVDAVYSLFDYETKLLNAETAIRRIEDFQTKNDISDARKKSTDWIDKILQLEPGSTSLDERGLVVRTHAEDPQLPYLSLADGHKGVITLVSDFIGRASAYYQSFLSRKKIRGIVLVDELDQHLHPSWQRRIIQLLHQAFPSIQFIVTTHTPMCALGATEIGDEHIELAVLERAEMGCRLVEDIPPPRGQTPDRILTSVLFGLATISDEKTSREIAEYGKLLSKTSHSESDKHRLDMLRERLSAFVSYRSNEVETLVSESLKDAVKEKIRLRLEKEPQLWSNARRILKDELALEAELLQQIGATLHVEEK